MYFDIKSAKSRQFIKTKNANNPFIKSLAFYTVPRTRVELARESSHYPLKVACLPIPPPGQSGGKNMFFFMCVFFRSIFFYFARYQ